MDETKQKVIVMDNLAEIWRMGDQLVMHKFSNLPDRCVKTNEPANGKRLIKKLSWHPRVFYLLILFGVITYVLIALCIQQKAIIEIVVSEKVLKKRRNAMVGAWILCVGAILLLFTDMNLLLPYWFLLINIIVFFSGVIWAVIAVPVVRAARIRGDYIWLKGVNKNYLADFPDWKDRNL